VAARTKSRKKKPAGRRAASKRSGPGRTRRVAGHLAPWARDAFGIGLVVLSLLAVLGLWLHSSGLVGKLIA